ncbi:universal stress protein [Salipiger sp. P9]|uniref:universal stress protein n=1 Tax=Salipiger pentaromativorans TaxID=2943193 RepID=UPI002157DBB5|nr:universal stress protein [Salipiger pentaromativorans]MCR8550270.1 universal stress protein [Salipiger pentaromativorans]
MFERIMVPVDLGHAEKLEKALLCAADLAAHYGATAVYVGVTTEQPSSLARTPAEYAQKLAAFAEDQAKLRGIATESKAYASHDPAVDLDPTLLKAVGETRADLVVMASHIPNIADHLWPSNGGSIATHTDVSVLLVR